MTTRTVTGVLLASVAALALGGCSTTIDAGKAEKRVKELTEQKFQVDVRSVDCPGGRKAHKGDVLTCRIVATDGSTATAKLTEKDDKGNVAITVIPEAARIDATRAAALIRSAVVRQVGARVKSVSCPPGRVAKAGDSFTCRVTGADGTGGDAIVNETDDTGQITVGAPFLHVTDIERSLGRRFAAALGGKATVTCPEIVEPQAGGRFRCRATGAAGGRRVVDVLQLDGQGHVRGTLRPGTGG